MDSNKKLPDAAELAEMALFPELNPGPVCRLSRQGNVLRANEAARKAFGEEDLTGSSWFSLCGNVDDTTWQRVLDCDSSFLLESTIGDKVFLFCYVCTPGKELVLAFGTDITALKDAERQLRKVARFPDMNPGPVLRLDTRGIVLLNNAATQMFFGHDIKGKCWLDLWPELKEGLWKKILSSEEVIPYEVRMHDCDYVFNHRRDFETDLVFVYGTDITAQKRAERILSQSEKMAQLGTLAAGIAHELNNPAAASASASQQLSEIWLKAEAWRNKLYALSETDAALVRLLEKQAHAKAQQPVTLSTLQFTRLEAEMEDWMTEQNIPRAYDYAAALVSMGYDAASLTEWLSRYESGVFFDALIWSVHVFQAHCLLGELKEASSRISEIVKAMKDYSYLDQAPVQEIDVHEGIDNTLIILRNKLKEGITVKREYGALPKITAYCSELNQVWTNILDNAIYAVESSGTISIRTRSSGSSIEVEIEDDGKGIPQEIQSKIFDPFFTTKPPGKGTGLGLTTAYGIVTEKHGGRIRLVSAPGKTQFLVELPVALER